MPPKKLIISFCLSLLFWSVGFFSLWHLYSFKIAFIVGCLGVGFYFRLVTYFQYRDWERENPGDTLISVEAVPVAGVHPEEIKAYEDASRVMESGRQSSF
jgi:hypothetical protein